MKKIALIIALFLPLIGCNTNTSETNRDKIVISIDDKEFDNSFYTSDIIDTSTVEFVCLEKTPEVIGSIDKLIVTDEQFIINDKTTKSVWVFNANGKYVNRINAQGRGPNEYVNLHTITFKKPNLIGLLDDGRRKIIWYSTLGEFVKSEEIPYYACDIYSGNNLLHLMYRFIPEDAPSSDKYYCHLIDEEHNSSARFLPYYQFGLHFGITDPFFIENNSELLIRNPFNTTLYEYKNDNLIEKYEIDFNKPPFPFNSYKNEGSSTSLMQDFENGNYRGSIREISFTSSHLSILYSDSGVLLNILYDKVNGVKKVFSGNMVDDFDLYYNHPKTAHKEYFYTILYPYTLLERMIERLGMKGDIESYNPIIMRFKYKDFLN